MPNAFVAELRVRFYAKHPNGNIMTDTRNALAIIDEMDEEEREDFVHGKGSAPEWMKERRQIKGVATPAPWRVSPNSKLKDITVRPWVDRPKVYR